MPHPPNELQLSVVIPAYNEAGRIEVPLRQIDEYLRRHHPVSEIVVVDDGSTDGTADLVRRVGHELATPIVVVASPQNRGKGYAIRLGMLRARGRVILMTDADLSTPIGELARFLPDIAAGAPVVIGSRRTAGAVVEVHQPLLRETMGRVFTSLTRLLLLQVSDVTCGFKLFTREAAAQIFSRMTLDDWSFDAEALFLARRLGLEIREVPVHWRDVPGTKVHRGTDAVRAAVGLVRIGVNALRGRYALQDRQMALPAPAGSAEGSTDRS